MTYKLGHSDLNLGQMKPKLCMSKRVMKGTQIFLFPTVKNYVVSKLKGKQTDRHYQSHYSSDDLFSCSILTLDLYI